MVQPSQNHRDPWFPPFFQEILEDSKMIFGTKEGTPYIYPGTGTGGWEVALTNTLSPGDKIVTFRYGQFSHLWVDMMKRLGLDVRLALCHTHLSDRPSIMEQQCAHALGFAAITA